MISALEKIVLGCTKCHLYDPHPVMRPLPGSGEGSKYLIVGIAPSYKRIKHADDTRNVSNPLSGNKKYTSTWLGKVIDETGWPLEDSYITNLIKCTLPGNREPTYEDLKTCFKLNFLQEVHILVPKLIICLGNVVYNSLVENMKGIDIPLEKVYHYAYIARKPAEYDKWKEQWVNLKEIYT